MIIKKSIILSICIASIAFNSQAQEHGKHHSGSEVDPLTLSATEPGQGAFAAIAEIVKLLEQSPNTDWSKVSIDVLREHLVDMNKLTLNSSVQTETNKFSVLFRISGDGRTKKAIQSMVIAHANELVKVKPWKSKAEKTAYGANLMLTAPNEHELRKIIALGFYGVMATGAHHQAHHLQMATGEGMH